MMPGMANGFEGMRFVQLNNGYYYKETPLYKRRLELEVSGYSRPFQQRTEICASRPVGLAARLEQVTFNGSTSSALV